MKIETKCLHEGYKPENGGPGVMPIVQSTTYRFDSTAKIASLFDMPTECIYSRFANPTCDAVEKKIASLEGGVGAMLTSSGQAAWMTISAPHSIGRHSTGVANVLSTMSGTLFLCAIFAHFSMSNTVSAGFASVSPNTALVLGRKAAFNSSSVQSGSTKVNSTPMRFMVTANRL